MSLVAVEQNAYICVSKLNQHGRNDQEIFRVLGPAEILSQGENAGDSIDEPSEKPGDRVLDTLNLLGVEMIHQRINNEGSKVVGKQACIGELGEVDTASNMRLLVRTQLRQRSFIMQTGDRTELT